jgi:DNA-binding transcriptional LysR family regulator
MFLALGEDHALASRRAVPLERLAAACWVSARPGSAYDEVLVSACRALGGCDPDIRHRTDNARVAVGLVSAGAVAIVS